MRIFTNTNKFPKYFTMIKQLVKKTILNILGRSYLSSPEKIWNTRRGMIMKYPPGHMGGTTVVQRIWGVFEPRVFKRVKQLIRPGMTTINLGACYGDYTIFMAKLVGPNGLVYAFEPLPYFFDLLSQNIELNKLDQRIIAINKAVDIKPGYIKVKFKLKSTNVSAIKLSSYIKQNRLHPDLILMDIEGFELSVLEDLMTDISNNLYTPIIIVETHDKLFPDKRFYWQHIKTFTSKCGYQTIPIDSAHYVLRAQRYDKPSINLHI